jgi:hypothetical protein
MTRDDVLRLRENRRRFLQRVLRITARGIDHVEGEAIREKSSP